MAFELPKGASGSGSGGAGEDAVVPVEVEEDRSFFETIAGLPSALYKAASRALSKGMSASVGSFQTNTTTLWLFGMISLII